MPRKSLRLKAIDVLKLHVTRLRREYILREIDDEEDSLEDEKYFRKKSMLDNMIQSRYLFRRSKYRRNRKKIDLDDALSYNSVNYNDEEFLLNFRITRDSFFYSLMNSKQKKPLNRNPKKNSNDLLLIKC